MISKKELVCKCPICDCIADYNHILEAHEEYWCSKGLYNKFPMNVKEFNNRFGPLGLLIIEDGF